MANLLRDVQYGWRMLFKDKSFAAMAVLTLALGVGPNATLFSVVKAVLINPLPFPESKQLYAVYWEAPHSDPSSFSFPNFLDLKRASQSFEALGAYRWVDYSLTGVGESEKLNGQMVSADFFPLLGINPLLGRGFTSEEDRAGAEPVVLISEALWKRKFGSSPKVLEQSVALNGKLYAVIGVVRARIPMFDPLPFDIFTPIGQWNDPTFLDRTNAMGTMVVGRLKRGVTPAQAREDMKLVSRNLGSQYPEADKESGMTIVPLKQDLVADLQRPLAFLLAAVGIVLLISCANVANLLLEHAGRRSHELAVRSALGANRGRLVQQLLTESVMLALGGGAVGLLFAELSMRLVLAFLPAYVPRSGEIRVDAYVLLLTMAASGFCGVFFGISPAIVAVRPNLIEILNRGGRGSSGTRHRAQNVFVIVQVALSVVLLAAAGLTISGLARLRKTELGFNPHNVLKLGLSFSSDKSQKPAAIRSALPGLSASFDSVPGVVSASAYAGALPLDGDSELSFWIKGRPQPAAVADMDVAMWHSVQPEFLSVMGIPLLRGRFFSPRDDEHSPKVVVIDDRFARQYFPTEDPLGKWIHAEQMNEDAEIVGVVGHVEQWAPGDTGHGNRQAQFYFPLTQLPNEILGLFSELGFVVRTSGPPQMLIESIRKASALFDSSEIVSDFLTMDQIVSRSMATQQLMMNLLRIFALLALTLSAVGIYGVISCSVTGRTREIGVRMALGAQRKDILRLIFTEGMTLALAGLAIGLLAAIGLARLMTTMVFGIPATSAKPFVEVSAILISVASLASYVPARRATRVDAGFLVRDE